MKKAVKLRYCLVNDQLHDVSDFAHLTPSKRPQAFCPECNDQLILKLSNCKSSNSKAHHAAHKSESHSCSLTSPEGILHFNTKHYIFEELKHGNKLHIKQNCAGWSLKGFLKTPSVIMHWTFRGCSPTPTGEGKRLK